MDIGVRMVTPQQLDKVVEAAARYKMADNADPHVHFDADLEYAEELLMKAIREAAGNPIIDRIKGFGIDADRLHNAMETEGQKAWGKMVHAFEFVTVLGVVEEEMLKRAQE